MKTCLLATLGLFGALILASAAPTIPNPSFEANLFTVPPGYISINGAITAWFAGDTARAGLNPASGSPFANNGAIPHGTNVAFIQSGPNSSLSTVISDLIIGQTYKINFRVNARSTVGGTPNLRVSIDGLNIINTVVTPVGGSNPYKYFAFDFTAAATAQTLTLRNDANGDQTVLLDDFSIAPRNSGWSYAAWNDDASSGVDGTKVYTHAYNFGSSAAPTISGINFIGVGSVNPSVTGSFSTAGLPNVYNNDANNLTTGGSSQLARDFVWGGNEQSITIHGLTAGKSYVATIYSVAFEDNGRAATFSVGNDRLTVNQDQFGDNNGIRISYSFTANSSSITLTYTPLWDGVTFHTYGFSTYEIPPRLTVTNALQLWLRADAGVTTNASGGVTQWQDQSGNTNHATQVTNTQAPLLVNAQLHHWPVLRFDGTNDFLNVADSQSLSFTGDLTTFCVIKFDDFANYNAIWGKTVGAFPAPTDLYTLPGSGVLRAFRGRGTTAALSRVDSAGPMGMAKYRVLAVQVTGATLTHYLHNRSNGSGAVNLNTLDGNTDLKIGTRQDQFTRLKGDLAELLIYSRALSPSERSDVFNYLQTKYNLHPLVVTNLADDGSGSLRQAIADAGPGNFITFDASLSGQTILLRSGQLNVSKNLTIDASSLAQGLTISGNHNSRILGVYPSATAILDSLTISDGNAVSGGGILIDNGGTLTLNRTTLAGNSAAFGGGIASYGTLTISNSTVFGNFAMNNSGGIENDGGTLRIEGSAIYSNAANYGGGIANWFSGTATVIGSEVSGNSAPFAGGILVNDGTITVGNTTLARNTANDGAGIANVNGVLTIRNSTLSANFATNGGGGILNYSTLALTALTNTIVAANTPNNISGSFSGANNLTTGNPLLAPLGNYGGPTQTMPPLHSSPAIDAGRDSLTNLFAADQRGYPRLSGVHVDIGAVEAQCAPAGNPPVLINPAIQNGGALSFTFGSVPNADFTVLASTNLSQWNILGPAAHNPPGQYHFTDPDQANHPKRFYKVASP